MVRGSGTALSRPAPATHVESLLPAVFQRGSHQETKTTCADIGPFLTPYWFSIERPPVGAEYAALLSPPVSRHRSLQRDPGYCCCHTSVCMHALALPAHHWMPHSDAHLLIDRWSREIKQGDYFPRLWPPSPISHGADGGRVAGGRAGPFTTADRCGPGMGGGGRVLASHLNRKVIYVLFLATIFSAGH